MLGVLRSLIDAAVQQHALLWTRDARGMGCHLIRAQKLAGVTSDGRAGQAIFSCRMSIYIYNRTGIVPLITICCV